MKDFDSEFHEDKLQPIRQNSGIVLNADNGVVWSSQEGVEERFAAVPAEPLDEFPSHSKIYADFKPTDEVVKPHPESKPKTEVVENVSTKKYVVSNKSATLIKEVIPNYIAHMLRPSNSYTKLDATPAKYPSNENIDMYCTPKVMKKKKLCMTNSANLATVNLNSFARDEGVTPIRELRYDSDFTESSLSSTASTERRQRKRRRITKSTSRNSGSFSMFSPGSMTPNLTSKRNYTPSPADTLGM